MATTPPTFSASAVLAAADLNLLRDGILELQALTAGYTVTGVQLVRSANQSLSDSTATEISWGADDFQFGSWWTSGTDITVPSSAIPATFTTIVLLVTARVKFAADTTGTRFIDLLLDGGTFAQRRFAALGGGNATDVMCTAFVEAAAAQVITLEATQDSGGALNASQCNITVMRYAPAS